MPADPEITAITKRATIDLVTAKGRPSQELLDRLYLVGYVNKLEAEPADVERALGGRRRGGLGKGIDVRPEGPAAPEADR